MATHTHRTGSSDSVTVTFVSAETVDNVLDKPRPVDARGLVTEHTTDEVQTYRILRPMYREDST
jgi:hypothetical protein